MKCEDFHCHLSLSFFSFFTFQLDYRHQLASDRLFLTSVFILSVYELTDDARLELAWIHTAMICDPEWNKLITRCSAVDGLLMFLNWIISLAALPPKGHTSVRRIFRLVFFFFRPVCVVWKVLNEIMIIIAQRQSNTICSFQAAMTWVHSNFKYFSRETLLFWREF